MPDVILKDVTQIALDRICLNLRKMDAIEIFNQRPHDSPIILSYETFHLVKERTAVGRIAWQDGVPVLVGGLAERWPNVWEVWMFGTDESKPSMFPMMRWLREQIKYYCYEHNVHRLECESHQDHTDAHAFLRAMGARQEGEPLAMYGKNGDDYLRFVWIVREGDALLNPTLRDAAE